MRKVKFFLGNLPDALSTNCSSCSEAQKIAADKLSHYLIDEKPMEWGHLEEKYDPDGEYRRLYLENKFSNNKSEDEDNSKKDSKEPNLPPNTPFEIVHRAAATATATATATAITATRSRRNRNSIVPPWRGQGGRTEVSSMDQSSIAGPAESAWLLPPKARGKGPLRRHTSIGYLLRRIKIGTSTQQGRTALGSGTFGRLCLKNNLLDKDEKEEEKVERGGRSEGTRAKGHATALW
ncbi:hypothetical protein HZH68_010154 [Vespula germanica]|uniref:Uncharacterized protein n=1 Tax=Vespula germanica TaxID=30212 RepID=A0A834JZY0_VESGE|nr:hypothetical protein HZH68_010154 [Vespula germanica]